MAQVTELITKFSFSGSTTPLLNFNQRLGSAIKAGTAFVAALAAGSAAFSKWASGVLETLDPLAQMEKRTGVAIGRIQELSFAATQNGSSIAAMQGSLLALNQTIGDAAQKGSEEFARLGISVRDMNGDVKNADQILAEVSERFRTMNLSMQEQETLASSLGIDATLVQMLNRSEAEMSALSARARELGTLTSDQADQVIRYNDALAQNRFAISSVKQLIAVGFAPELTRLTQGFTDLIAENKEWIITGAEAVIEIAAGLLKAFFRIGEAVMSLVGSLGEGTKAAGLFVGALVLISRHPYAAIVTGIFLAVDDLVTAMNGGQSVIADFFQEFLGVDIVAVLQEINGALQTMFDLIEKLLRLEFESFFSDIGAMGESTFQGLQRLFRGGSFGDPGDPGTVPTNAATTRPGDLIRTGPGPGNMQPGMVIQQTNNIEVRTDDPNAAGRSVRDNLDRQLDDAQTQFNVGGR